jgi:hypothetical protein
MREISKNNFMRRSFQGPPNICSVSLGVPDAYPGSCAYYTKTVHSFCAKHRSCSGSGKNAKNLFTNMFLFDIILSKVEGKTTEKEKEFLL